MSDCVEVLFASDDDGQFHSAKCFDPHIGGTTLMTYKNGGGVSPNTLSLLGKDYLVSADNKKPLLRVWPLSSQEPVNVLKMVMPGKVSALAINPDGNYCVAGIDEKLYIWEISTGSLLNVISRHYQKITKIIFTDDSSYFVSAAEDGSVMVWKLSDVIAKQTGNIYRASGSNVQPFYNFTRHALPVTDIFLGKGDKNSRLFTVSTDQTCKIYSMKDGCFLVSVIFDHAITAAVTNSIETHLFVGLDNGKIQVFDLEPYPRTLEHHVSESNKEMLFFNGHEKAITCLSISIEGHRLASGSQDGNIMLWDVPSRQMMKIFELKGPITNVFFAFASQNMFRQQLDPSLIINNFERVSKPEKQEFEVNLLVKDELEELNYDNEFMLLENSQPRNVADNALDVANLKKEVVRLKQINKQLYEFAMDKLIKNPLALGKGEGESTELGGKKKKKLVENGHG